MHNLWDFNEEKVRCWGQSAVATDVSLQLYLGVRMLRLLEKINLLKYKKHEQKKTGSGSNGGCLSLLQRCCRIIWF